MAKSSSEEIDRAVLEFCDAVRQQPKAFRGHRRQIQALQSPEDANGRSVRRRLGARLIARYRKQTGVVGAIDWDKFRQWLNDHMGQIDFARLVVSILMLLLML